MIRRAIALSILHRYSEAAIRLGALIVLARWITPEQIGVFVVAATFIGLVSIVAGFAQEDYLIQETELTPQRRGAALGLSLTIAVGCVFALIGVLAILPSGYIPDQLRLAVLVLAVGVLCHPISTAIIAVLQRQLQFDRVLIIGILRSSLVPVVAIMLAVRGFGALSLAWAGLVADIAGVILAVALAGDIGCPTPRFRGWTVLGRFGGMQMVIRFLDQAADVGIAGSVSQFLGFTATGLLSRAQTIRHLFQELVLQGIKPVALSVLAERRRRGDCLKSAYLLKLSYMSALAWPFFAFLALFAEPIVQILLGAMWSETVPLVRILCVGGIFVPFTSLSDRFYVALGWQRRYLRRQLILQPVSFGLVAAGALVSLEIAAAAVVASSPLKAILDAAPMKRGLGYTWADVSRVVAPSVVVAAVTVLPVTALVAVFGLPGKGEVSVLVGGAALATLGWTAGVTAIRHPLRTELARVWASITARVSRSSHGAGAFITLGHGGSDGTTVIDCRGKRVTDD